MANEIKNTYVNLEGKIMWAKLFEHNRDKKGYNDSYVDTNGRTTLNLIMDQKNYELLRKSGSLKRGKPAEQAGYMDVKFDRKWETGRDWDSGEPAVYRADGNPWDVKVDGEIGNESTVRVQLVVTYFPGPKTYSTRIEKVKVLDLVEYSGHKDDFAEDETGSMPPKANSAPDNTPAPSTADLDDEIPF